jgi:hypothetical protein
METEVKQPVINKGWQEPTLSHSAKDSDPETLPKERPGVSAPKPPGLPKKPTLKSRLYLNAHICEALEKKVFVRNQGVIDIDQLDHNISEVQKALPARLPLRLRVGSLPNPHLLLYMAQKLGTQRLYVVHPGILFEILSMPQFDEFDIWLGRSLPKQVFETEFWQNDPEVWARLSRMVRFQVGSKEELGELIRFSHDIGKTLKVCLDFDCGKRRGGFQKFKDVEHAIRMIKASSGAVSLSGISASDEHLPLAPKFYSRWITSNQTQFAKIQSFVLILKEMVRSHGYGAEVPVLGGCSRTLGLHVKGTHLDEFCLGSLFLGSSYIFSNSEFSKFESAFYISNPITHSDKYFRAPFMGSVLSFLYQKIFYSKSKPTWVLGGPWSGVWAHDGIEDGPSFLSQKKQARLLPDQSFVWLRTHENVHKNKILLFVPEEPDTMLMFNENVVIRNGQILGTWRNFRHTH